MANENGAEDILAKYGFGGGDAATPAPNAVNDAAGDSANDILSKYGFGNGADMPDPRKLGFSERHGLLAQQSIGYSPSEAYDSGIAKDTANALHNMIPFMSKVASANEGAVRDALTQVAQAGKLPTIDIITDLKGNGGLQTAEKEWLDTEGKKYDLYKRALNGDNDVDYSPIYAKKFNAKTGRYEIEKDENGAPLLDTKYDGGDEAKESARAGYMKQFATEWLRGTEQGKRIAAIERKQDTSGHLTRLAVGATESIGFATELILGGYVSRTAMAAGMLGKTMQGLSTANKLGIGGKLAKNSVEIFLPTVANAMERFNQLTADDVVINDDGSIGFKNANGNMLALGKSVSGAYSENLVEVILGYTLMKVIGGPCKWFGGTKFVKQLFSKSPKFAQSFMTKARDIWFDGIKMVKKIGEVTKFNDPFTEFLEEYVQGAMDDVVGLGQKDFASTDSIGDFTKRFLSWDDNSKDLVYGILGQTLLFAGSAHVHNRARINVASFDHRITGALKEKGFSSWERFMMGANKRLAAGVLANTQRQYDTSGKAYSIDNTILRDGEFGTSLREIFRLCGISNKRIDNMTDREAGAALDVINEILTNPYGAIGVMNDMNKGMRKIINMIGLRAALDGNWNNVESALKRESRTRWEGTVDANGNVNWQTDDSGRTYVEDAATGARIYRTESKNDDGTTEYGYTVFHPELGEAQPAPTVSDALNWASDMDKVAQERNEIRQKKKQYVGNFVQRIMPERTAKDGTKYGANVVAANNADDALLAKAVPEADKELLAGLTQEEKLNEAFTSTRTGTVYIFVDNVDSVDKMMYTIAHELGNHAAFGAWADDKAEKNAAKDGKELSPQDKRNEKDSLLSVIVNAVYPNSRTANEERAEYERNERKGEYNAEGIAREEALAYGNEMRMPDANAIRRAVTAVKMYMNEKFGGNFKLTDDDYNAIATAGLNKIKQAIGIVKTEAQRAQYGESTLTKPMRQNTNGSVANDAVAKAEEGSRWANDAEGIAENERVARELEQGEAGTKEREDREQEEDRAQETKEQESEKQDDGEESVQEQANEQESEPKKENESVENEQTKAEGESEAGAKTEDEVADGKQSEEPKKKTLIPKAKKVEEPKSKRDIVKAELKKIFSSKSKAERNLVNRIYEKATDEEIDKIVKEIESVKNGNTRYVSDMAKYVNDIIKSRNLRFENRSPAQRAVLEAGKKRFKEKAREDSYRYHKFIEENMPHSVLFFLETISHFDKPPMKHVYERVHDRVKTWLYDDEAIGDTLDNFFDGVKSSGKKRWERILFGKNATIKKRSNRNGNDVVMGMLQEFLDKPDLTFDDALSMLIEEVDTWERYVSNGYLTDMEVHEKEEWEEWEQEEKRLKKLEEEESAALAEAQEAWGNAVGVRADGTPVMSVDDLKAGDGIEIEDYSSFEPKTVYTLIRREGDLIYFRDKYQDDNPFYENKDEVFRWNTEKGEWEHVENEQEGAENDSVSNVEGKDEQDSGVVEQARRESEVGNARGAEGKDGRNRTAAEAPSADTEDALTLDGGTPQQLAAEQQRNTERAEVKRRLDAPLKTGTGEVGQSLLDLGGAEGEDLFNRTASKIEEASKSDGSPQVRWRRLGELGFKDRTEDEIVRSIREDRFSDGETRKVGAQSIVYRAGDKVIKLRDTDGDLADALSKIKWFNSLFPDMAYSIREEKTIDNGGKMRLVLEQPYVDAVPNSGTDARKQLVKQLQGRFGAENVQTHGDIGERNLLKPQSWFWIEAGPWRIEDLKDLNLGIDRADGKVKVWDAEIAYDAEKDAEGKAQGRWRRKSSALASNGIYMGSFFSGAGTIEDGLRGAIKSVFGVEYDKDIAEQYRKSHGDQIINADIRDVDIDKLGKVNYFHASPVCHHFSATGDRTEQPLDILTAEKTAEVIRRKHPAIVTVENAPAYRNSKSVERIRKALRDGGYNFDEGVYNASDFGGTMERKRYILRAVRNGELPKVAKTAPTPWGSRITRAEMDALKDGELRQFQKDALAKAGIDEKHPPKEPVLIFGGGKAGDRLARWSYASELARSIVASPKGSQDYIVLPNGNVKEVNGRVLAKLMGLSSEFYVPDDYKLARQVIGNGMSGDMVRGVIKPLFEGRENEARFRRGKVITPEEDAKYMDAVKRGDMETAQGMVREAAAKAMPNLAKDKDGLPRMISTALDAPDVYKAWHSALPPEAAREVASWKTISKSPYSDSFYNSNGITWNSKPDGSLRIADHWNFMSRGEYHCKTTEPIEDGKWSLGRYDASSGKYTILKTWERGDIDYFKRQNNQHDQSRKIEEETRDKAREWYLGVIHDENMDALKKRIGKKIHTPVRNGILRDVSDDGFGGEKITVEVLPSHKIVEFSGSTIYDLISAMERSGEITRPLKNEYFSKQDDAKVFLDVESGHIKSAATVTRDDAGNVIPLSERFDEEKDDIRWRKTNTEEWRDGEQLFRRSYTPNQVAQLLADKRILSTTDKMRGIKYGVNNEALLAAEKLARQLSQHGSISPEIKALAEATKKGGLIDRSQGVLSALISRQNISQWRERLQDSLISLNEMENKLGISKADSPYYQFDRNYGIVADKVRALDRDVIVPLAEELRNNNIGIADFQVLLQALHGGERNRMIAERSPYVLKALDNEDSIKIVKDILLGNRELDDKALDDISTAVGWIDKDGKFTKERKLLERDLAGSGATTAYWNKQIADFKKSGLFDKAEKAVSLVRKLTKRNRDILVETGRLSQKQADKWEELSPNYVPLRSDMEMDDNIWSKWLLGGAMGDKSSGGKRYAEGEYNHAYGRGTLADNPLEFAIQQYHDSLHRAYDNVARTRLANIVRDNPNLGKVFRYEAEMTDKKREKYAKSIAIIKNMVKAGTATEDDIAKMRWYQEAFNAEKAIPMVKVLGSNGIVYEVPNIAGLEGNRNNPTGIIAFKENGELKFIKLGGFEQGDISGDPENGIPPNTDLLDDVTARRIATAVKKQNMAELNVFGNALRKATGVFSALRTAYSPTFLVSNFGADNTQALRNIYSTFGIKGAIQFEKYAYNALKAAQSVLSGEYGDNKIQQYAKEWANNGGRIGGMASSSISDLTEDIKRTMRKIGSKQGKFADIHSVRDVVQWANDRKDDFMDLAEKWNSVVEMSTRIASYATARDMGYSVADAVSYSRDITVNFNRKGTLTPWLNAIYAFSNASFQDLHRSLIAFSEGRVGTGTAILAGRGAKMFLGLSLMGFIASMFGYWQDDTDDEEEGNPQWKYVKDWQKQNVMGIRIGEKTYGMPIRGISRIPYYLGHQVWEMMSGRKNVFKAALDTAMLAADSTTDFTGQASSPLMTAVPSVMRDPIDIFIGNKTFTGRNRYREPLPGQEETAVRSEMGRGDTSDAAKAIAKALNRITLGDSGKRGLIDVQPEKISGVFEWIFGSAGSDVANALGTVKDIATLNIQNRPVKNLPYLSRFVRKIDENSADFYSARQKYEQAKRHYNGMNDICDTDAMAEDVAKHPWLATRGRGAKWGQELKDLDNGIKKLLKIEKSASKDDYDAIHALRLKAQYQFMRRLETPPQDDAVGVEKEKAHAKTIEPLLRSAKRAEKNEKREKERRRRALGM